MSNPLLPPFYMSHTCMTAERNDKGATWPPSRERSDKKMSDEEKEEMLKRGIRIKGRRNINKI